jgi:hypothetical protein
MVGGTMGPLDSLVTMHLNSATMEETRNGTMLDRELDSKTMEVVMFSGTMEVMAHGTMEE